MEYEILDTLEFTSDRKRMSVVLKEVHSGKLMLLTKGADEVIFSSLRTGMLYRFVETKFQSKRIHWLFSIEFVVVSLGIFLFFLL